MEKDIENDKNARDEEKLMLTRADFLLDSDNWLTPEQIKKELELINQRNNNER